MPISFGTKIKIFFSGGAGCLIGNSRYKYKYSSILLILFELMVYFLLFVGVWSFLLGKIIYVNYVISLLAVFILINLLVFFFVDIVKIEP
jgi:hypothetical protein